MSDSVSTATKTLTNTTDTTASTGEPLVTDRWTHNITYRQLVISSCIGITQMWWHPYIHDLSKLVPFLVLYNVLSIFIAYPIFYLELAIGVVTKKGVLNSWDMSPAARGIGFAMLISCVFTAFTTSTVTAYCLAMFVHSFHSFLPWLHCAAAANPPCAARHRQMVADSETPAQSFFLNYVLNLKRNGLSGGLGNIVTELSIYYCLSWLIIYVLTLKRLYSYSKILLFKDVLAFFVISCCAFGAARLKGAQLMFELSDWTALSDVKLWRQAMEYCLIEMTISQGSLVMLGAYCPKEKYKLSATTILAFFVAKACCVCSQLILGAAHGALARDYGLRANVIGGPAASMILWADYVARVPGNQFWSALIFFTLFVVSLSSTGLLIQTIMSSFTGRSVRKLSSPILLLACLLFALIGAITLCAQGGLYILQFLLVWPVAQTRVPIAAMTAIVITYVYGQSNFCEDVYFSVGEYPNVMARLSWALAPIYFIATILSMVEPPENALGGWITILLTLAPIVIVFVFYMVFKCRVRAPSGCRYRDQFSYTKLFSNIVHNEK